MPSKIIQLNHPICYQVELSNGFKFYCTGDTQIKTSEGAWLTISDISPCVRLNIEYKKIDTEDFILRRFKSVINTMHKMGLEITKENYESLRGKLYNIPLIPNILRSHPEYESFDDIIEYAFLDPLDLMTKWTKEFYKTDNDESAKYTYAMFALRGSFIEFHEAIRIFDNIIDKTHRRLLKELKGVSHYANWITMRIYETQFPYITSIKQVSMDCTRKIYSPCNGEIEIPAISKFVTPEVFNLGTPCITIRSKKENKNV